MRFKSILVANNHLESVGGSETFTYTLIESLLKQGYDVEYFTFFKGIVSSRIEQDLGVEFMSKSGYDLILANHNTCVNYLHVRGKTIQTCHGVYPELEQPVGFADGYISISEEVKNHLLEKGYRSKLIVNGINCNRYTCEKPINSKLKKVLSLSQSELANNDIKAACDILGISFLKFNKHKNPVWHLENEINNADLVVALGRSAYEAMACGRTVLAYDNREYSESFSDGYLTVEMVEKALANNCSGRYLKLKMNVEDLIDELKKYKKEDGVVLRELALKTFNIELQVDKILGYAEKVRKKRRTLKSFFISIRQKRKIKIKKRAIERANKG